MKTLTPFATSEFKNKLLQVRLNRLLAWALLIMPAMQIAFGTRFWPSLVIDLLLLLLHALLSLTLFGTPRAHSFLSQHWSRRFFGGKRTLLVGKDIFLLDAWRILISLINPGLLFIFTYLWMIAKPIAEFIVVLGPPLFCAAIFFVLLLHMSIWRHVGSACDLAFKRWGVNNRSALLLGRITSFVFLFLFYVESFKRHWL